MICRSSNGCLKESNTCAGNSASSSKYNSTHSTDPLKDFLESDSGKNLVSLGKEEDVMFCAEKELGLAEESQGIWLLPEDTPLGIDVVDHFKIRDTILDVAILPNRGDAQSILGLAREAAIILNKQLKQPLIEIKEKF